MSKIKESNYYAKKNFGDLEKELSFYSLNHIPGIYMITNKVTKKYYIGMSKNLKGILYNYLNINRLKNNKFSRINRALLKFGFDKFSISILELPQNLKIEGDFMSSTYLRDRKDFFIKVFRPQYNIRRSCFNVDIEFKKKKKKKLNLDFRFNS